jgi:hypothetical protein
MNVLLSLMYLFTLLPLETLKWKQQFSPLALLNMFLQIAMLHSDEEADEEEEEEAAL